MRKIDRFIDELQELKKKGYDAKKVDALTEGVNLIAAEYRRRKAKEDAQKKAMVESTGFAKLDAQYKASGLSMAAFVEGVGKTIIDSKHPDNIKNRMMDTLGKFASLTESANTIATRWAEGTLDDNDKKMLADGNVEGFKKSVLERTQMAFRWAAQAKFDEVANLVTDKTAMYKGYSLARAIINTPDEKLLLLKSAHPTGNGLPSFVYAAKVSQTQTLESVGNTQVPTTPSLLTPDEIAAFKTVHAVLTSKEEELSSIFGDEDWTEAHVTMALELIDDMFTALHVE